MKRLLGEFRNNFARLAVTGGLLTALFVYGGAANAAHRTRQPEADKPGNHQQFQTAHQPIASQQDDHDSDGLTDDGDDVDGGHQGNPPEPATGNTQKEQLVIELPAPAPEPQPAPLEQPAPFDPPIGCRPCGGPVVQGQERNELVACPMTTQSMVCML